MDAVIKKIPYGMTDFERIILENYYYVDKTQYIAKVEKVTSFFFFVRPRPFCEKLFPNKPRFLSKHARFILRHQPKR